MEGAFSREDDVQHLWDVLASALPAPWEPRPAEESSLQRLARLSRAGLAATSPKAGPKIIYISLLAVLL